ncbi:MAG: cell division protein SepF [Micrococcales bacterium]|nr:cell division protein SepF [Micrococcales bacterium]
MAGALRKTMVYLGLAEEDDEYYDGEYTDEPEQSRQAARPAGATAAREHTGAEVTHLPARPTVAAVVNDPEPSAMSRITTIHPRTYNEAKDIGESFRDGTPVIMNLSEMDDQDAKRLVDFAAGLVFGLSGQIERVTAKVFLLSPASVEVMSEAPADTGVRGPFNQS